MTELTFADQPFTFQLREGWTAVFLLEGLLPLWGEAASGGKDAADGFGESADFGEDDEQDDPDLQELLKQLGLSEEDQLPPGVVRIVFSAHFEDEVPTPAQVAALGDVLAHPEDYVPVIRSGVRAYLQSRLQDQDLALLANGPTPDELLDETVPETIYIRREEIDGKSLVGFHFVAPWEAEGFGVVLRGREIVEVGPLGVVMEGPLSEDATTFDDPAALALRSQAVAAATARMRELETRYQAMIAADPYMQLRVALANGDYAEAERLIASGVNVNSEREDFEHPLFEAIQDGNVEQVEWLLDHGADPLVESSEGETPRDAVQKLKRQIRVMSDFRDALSPVVQAEMADAPEALAEFERLNAAMDEQAGSVEQLDAILTLLKKKRRR